jgi:very-short-patch-repair endonuclease
MRGSQPWKTNRSRALRAQHVSAEDKLWRALRNRQLGGFKFVRQAPVEGFFADFLCRQRKLIVEVDGATHGEPGAIRADGARTVALQKAGYRIFRVTNADVFENLQGVLETLHADLEGRL